MKKHRAIKQTNLVCRICTDKGCSAKDVKLYHCDGCDRDLGHARFEKDSLYDKARTGRSQAGLMCLECQSKIPCDACKTRYPKTAWPVQVLKNQKKQGSTIVCSSCKEQGRTADDINLYTCQRCHLDLGSKRFEIVLLEHFKHHGRQKLICLACTREEDKRERLLHFQFRGSKIFCKCGCPIHRERCPLSPCYFGERRWPGCDGIISAEDRLFLDEIRPAPDWWRKAWHK